MSGAADADDARSPPTTVAPWSAFRRERHGFAGVGQSTHGQHNRGRHPGSIGACSYPARVFKGIKMGGRMGHTNVTIQNLKVLRLFPEKNLILVSGSVPGAKNSIITLHK